MTEALIPHEPAQDINLEVDTSHEGHTAVNQEKVWRMEKILALYVGGFSHELVAVQMAAYKDQAYFKSAQGIELVKSLTDKISEFLIEISKFSEEEKKSFGLVLPMALAKILKSIEANDWASLSESTDKLNAWFDGMETALSLISTEKEIV